MPLSDRRIRNAQERCEGRHALPKTLTIETAARLAESLGRISLYEPYHLILDASAVERVTTPGLQILVSFGKTVSALGGSLSLLDPSVSLTQACADTGLTGLLAYNRQEHSA